MKGKFVAIGRLMLLCAIMPALFACSGEDSSATDTATAVSAVTSTTAPFQYAYSGDSQETLNELANSIEALDQSKIADACGIQNSLIVMPTGLRYFKWQTSAWVEHFEFENAPPGSTDSPFIVTTRDYTGDGILDFLVGFRESAPYGAVLSSQGPTCDWKWMTFVFPDGKTSQLVDNLSWSDETLVLSGVNKSGLEQTANLRFAFDQTKLQFAGQDDPYSNPDMAWIGDACEKERSLLPQVFEARKWGNEQYVDTNDTLDYYDGEEAKYIVDEWLAALDDAIRALETVGPYTLNLTSREINYLNDLFVPKYGRYYGYGKWVMNLDQVSLAHSLLAPYCEMLPPRL